MQDFLCDQDRNGIANKALDVKRARECNVQSIRALDGELASMWKCLKDFYAESMPTRIKVGQHRALFPVDVLDEPEEARRCCRLRSWTVDSDVRRRVEVDWSAGKLFLGESLGQCGNQWYSRYWLYGRGSVRGVARYDNLHRRHNTWVNAICSAGFGSNLSRGHDIHVLHTEGRWP